MFTGIIKDTGKVAGIKRKSRSMEITIKGNLKLSEGDSVSVNGICLTVKAKNGNRLIFDISNETLERSNIDKIRIGNVINLEPAITPEDMLSGHIVQGHIDGTGKIKVMRKTGDNIYLKIALPKNIMAYIVEKGSIAVDGISLTVASIENDGIGIAVIPYTIENTNLKYRNKGDVVNIETDIIGKYIKKFMEVR